jgi:hypothetical protein
VQALHRRLNARCRVAMGRWSQQAYGCNALQFVRSHARISLGWGAAGACPTRTSALVGYVQTPAPPAGWQVAPGMHPSLSSAAAAAPGMQMTAHIVSSSTTHCALAVVPGGTDGQGDVELHAGAQYVPLMSLIVTAVSPDRHFPPLVVRHTEEYRCTQRNQSAGPGDRSCRNPATPPPCAHRIWSC